MKKFVQGMLVLAALIIVVVVTVTYFPDVLNPPQNGADTSDSATIDGGTNTVEPPSAEALARPANATLSHVAYVHDGDTLYLQPDGTHSREDQIKVRLIGIDTPELRPEAECFALEARDYLRRMLPEGAEVWIMSDRESVDQYGRSLLYLWTMDDRSVNLSMVADGYATALNIPPSNTYWRQFDVAEASARQANLGLWGFC